MSPWRRLVRWYREEMRLLEEHKQRMSERRRRREEWQAKAAPSPTILQTGGKEL